MTKVVQKIVRIGNSRGIRLSKPMIRKYGLYEKVVLEERPDGLVIKSTKSSSKLSYEETFKMMKKEKEDWSDLDNTLSDSLE